MKLNIRMYPTELYVHCTFVVLPGVQCTVLNNVKCSKVSRLKCFIVLYSVQFKVLLSYIQCSVRRVQIVQVVVEIWSSNYRMECTPGMGPASAS